MTANAPSPGVPVGVPAASSTDAMPFPNPGPGSRLRATTTPRFGSSVSSPARAGHRQLAAVQASLSARDWAVLQSLSEHRYLTTRQVEAFHFHGHASLLSGARVCRRVLHRLQDLRLILHLERRVGGVRAGSASFVWQLGPLGDRLLSQRAGQRRTRRYEPSLLFLNHCLAVADAHLALVTADRAGQLRLEDTQTEPACWRPYSGIGGARLLLQPDLYAVTDDPTDPDYVNHWFLEVDRGSEHRRRLLAKCHRYEDYRRTGQENPNGGFPLVLWLMRTSGEATRLRAAISADSGLDPRLYRVTTIEQLVDTVRRGVT